MRCVCCLHTLPKVTKHVVVLILLLTRRLGGQTIQHIEIRRLLLSKVESCWWRLLLLLLLQLERRIQVQVAKQVGLLLNRLLLHESEGVKIRLLGWLLLLLLWGQVEVGEKWRLLLLLRGLRLDGGRASKEEGTIWVWLGWRLLLLLGRRSIQKIEKVACVLNWLMLSLRSRLALTQEI